MCPTDLRSLVEDTGEDGVRTGFLEGPVTSVDPEWVESTQSHIYG